MLVLPLRQPVIAAKQLATLDRLSGGRLILGLGAGWLEEEFDACNVEYRKRGHLLDEAIDVLRACWGSAPASFAGPTVSFRDMKVQPLPERPIPLWVGGVSDRALRRAVEQGDGWHGAFQTIGDIAAVVKRLRADRPEPGFTLSMRLDVDGLSGDLDALRRELDELAAIGISHVLTSPVQRSLDDWLASVEALWGVFSEYREGGPG